MKTRIAILLAAYTLLMSVIIRPCISGNLHASDIGQRTIFGQSLPRKGQ